MTAIHANPFFLVVTLQIWNLGSPDPNFTVDAHQKGVNCVDYFTGGDKPFLITGADDHTAKVCQDVALHRPINLDLSNQSYECRCGTIKPRAVSRHWKVTHTMSQLSVSIRICPLYLLAQRMAQCGYGILLLIGYVVPRCFTDILWHIHFPFPASGIA